MRKPAHLVISLVTGCIFTGVLSGAASAEEVPGPTATPTPGVSASPTVMSSPSPVSTTSPAPVPTPSLSAVTTPTATATTVRSTAAVTLGGYPRFYRPTRQRGDRDGAAAQMKNIRELQYRLRWSGVYTGPVTGYFGPLTEDGVKAFQRKYLLPVTGKADLRTWQTLISKTTKRLSAVPSVCKRSGFHTCYDRSTHQLFAYENGVLWNVWLVRGGDKSAQTDLGTFTVFARYAYKTSSIYGSPMYYFQKYNGGEGIHGSQTMLDPFVGHSYGCVNMYVPDAKVLWDMSANKRHIVTVYGAWS
ncbi:hypothetical protein C3Y87_01570 [Carbonactinospora thermoautotrophica]|uniref:L,D-transpeptidase family protein n=1 Tax=Carbonactinospora thermoautotrophica TaxID=1469144 RepID=UPI00226EFA38|nr:L,D-transpeptidase family protein [Carbonactinospora thermoautotrophica]MCX9190120.1 hypothetical protein [Carbonactinospora thermoautotrophica]